MDTGKIYKDATMIKIGSAIYYCNSWSRLSDIKSLAILIYFLYSVLERFKHLFGGTTTTCVLYAEKDVMEFLSKSLSLKSLDCMAIIMLRGR